MHVVYLFFIVIAVIVPYIFILFAYIKIFARLAASKNLAKLAKYENPSEAAREGKRVTGEARAARVFAIIAGIFVISWMPVFYMTAAGALKKRGTYSQRTLVSFLVYYDGWLAGERGSLRFFQGGLQKGVLATFSLPFANL